MQSLPDEFLVLSRQLGRAQQRCSDVLAAQAAQVEALQADVVRLRAAVVVRDTRLALLHEELNQLRSAVPGGARRQAMACHIRALVERIATLSRECLRWRLAAERPHIPAQSAGAAAGGSAPACASGSSACAPTATTPGPVPQGADRGAFDACLAAADLVICQTGCLGHDDYWRVQDHCRRTGKVCVLVDQSLAARQADVLASFAPVLASLRNAPEGEAPVPDDESFSENRPARLLFVR